MKKLLGFIDRNPLLLFHYLPLTVIVFLAHYFSVNKFFNLETLTQTNPILGWSLLTIWYYVFLLIGDNLIHKAIGKD
jgi:hypothetical protein